jgi:hypothetical protein
VNLSSVEFEEMLAKRGQMVGPNNKIIPIASLPKGSITDPMPKPVKANKYRAKRTEVEGIMFDSKAEAKRWETLRTMWLCGEIRCVVRQPEFLLPGKVRYRADFLVWWKHGRVSIEDVKGMRTPAYIMKRKQMKAVWGIDIEEK